MIPSHRLTGCRVCGADGLQLVLDLGRTALANRFLKPAQLADPEPTAPLRLVRCAACGLMQIDETVPPEVLFADYVYVSGTSDLIRRHAAELAERSCERYGLGPSDLVAELASNDGTVLQAFQREGVRVLGVEPAANIAGRADEAGVPTVCAFFDEGVGRSLRREIGPARLVVARHVLAHVAGLHSFVQGIAEWLADDGVAVVEVPHLLPFYLNLEYDTVYHEHLCYFSVAVLERLFDQHGLELIDVEEVAVHGGSILVSAQRRRGPNFVRSSVIEVLAREADAGLNRPEAWAGFASRVADSRDRLRGEIARLRRRGLRLAGYGAAAKGMTLLSYCGLGPAELPYLVDRSPYKQGLYTPGHHIPVVPPERLAHDPPDVLLVLAWNFASEIVAQQAAFAARGGRFLLPLPAPHYAGEARAAAGVAS